MRAGQLDQRITLEQRVQGQDEFGQPVDTWAPFLTAWAAVEPLAGREFIAAMAAVSEVTARVRLRYRPGVTSAMRVNHGGTLYGITHVADVRSARRELQLMCKMLA